MTLADRIIVTFAVCMVAALYGLLWQPQHGAAYAQIIVENRPIERIDLNTSQTRSVQGVLGVSQLQVQDHRIRFVHSPCSNKVCIHYGWLQYHGEMMACLPNRVRVELSGGVARFDAISF